MTDDEVQAWLDGLDPEQVGEPVLQEVRDLAVLSDRVGVSDDEVADAVQRALGAGAPWLHVGLALGMSTAKARERFRRSR